jgi:hypothetical protein
MELTLAVRRLRMRYELVLSAALVAPGVAHLIMAWRRDLAGW